MRSSIALASGLVSLAAATVTCDNEETGYTCDTTIAQNWGEQSPYFSVPSEISDDVPEGCAITFVNLLSRHGARFPTTSKTADYEALIEQIHADTKSYSADYAFIKDYTYDLGANDLTLFGQIEMYYSGEKFYNRYKTLTDLFTPFFRSSSDDRVVESAQNFSQGFHAARGSIDPTYPYPIEILSEANGFNNSLYNQRCTQYVNGSDADVNNYARDDWLDVWGDEVKDIINDNLVGAGVSKSQVIYFMDLCPYNTVATENGTISAFCNLFNETIWSYYNYYYSLDKWYEDLQGNPLGPTQGVGWAAELIARMTDDRTYVTDKYSYTSINHTLDDSQATFPLGDLYPLYADFTHDDDLSANFAALGLYNATADLSNTTLETTTQTNGYSAAWTVPFSARAYFEKMLCVGDLEELVRVVINDRVVPLQNCDADDLGRCTLSKFVASQTFVTEGGHWDQCFT